VWPAVFVWGVWALMFGMALACVRSYGSDVPFYDEWFLVPVLADEEPVTATWLWSQHEEHRIPLPRLLYLFFVRVTGLGFVGLMYFNAVALAVVAMCLIVAVKRLRGRTVFSDAFLATAILNVGGVESYVWGFAVQLVLSAVLAGVVLAVIGESQPQVGFTGVCIAGICLVLMPLTGASGLVMVPPLAGWLIYAGVRHWTSDVGQKRTSAMALFLAVVALAECAAYVIGYAPGTSPANPGLRATAVTALQALSMSLGPAGTEYWPYSGVAVFALLAVTAILLIVLFARQPTVRTCSAGMLLFLVAITAVALAIGFGRGGYEGSSGLQTRYVVLMTLALCGIYLAWAVNDLAAGRFVQMLLFVVACGFFLDNLRTAKAVAEPIRQQLSSFEQDAARGMDAADLAERHTLGLFPGARDWPEQAPRLTDFLAARIIMMQKAKIGPFRQAAAPRPP
jgi:hypothetical protein